MLSRRRTLALLAGGCSPLGTRPEPRTRLDGIWLVNDRADPQDCVLVRFTLTRGSGIQPWTKAYRRCDGEASTA
ncbi:MAG: hypothetical protein V5A62_14335 [Haloarculaceae archaeon]